MKYRLFAVLAFSSVLPQVAQAVPTRPTCVANPNCNAALPSCSVSGTNVCSYNSATDTWSCDIDIGTGGNPQAVVVADFQIGGSTYCNTRMDFAAWGTTRGGTAFFCSFDSTSTDPVVDVELHGTPAVDHLCFRYSNWTLENPLDTSDGVSFVYGTMFGENGADLMDGSIDDYEDAWGNPNYLDTLIGDGGDDDIFGLGGDDVCLGNDGADEIDGGWGDDDISLGNGNDTAWGDLGDDLICGQADTDTLNGNDGVDILDGGGSGSDTKNGGLGADECDSAGTNVSCTTVPIATSYTCP